MTRRLGMIVLALILAMLVAFAQRNPPLDQETVLTFVHDFLQVFYPDLISKGHRLRLSVDHPADSSWREITGVFFTAFPERPPDYGAPRFQDGHMVPETRPDPNTVLLDGRIWLPPLEHGSRIQEVFASTVVNAEKLEILGKLVASHPEWSDALVISALKHAGAQFGPDDKEAFVSSIPVEKLARFLGRLKITSVEFRLVRPDPPNRSGKLDIFWSVRATAKFSDGTSSDYVFAFEPFDGKLTLLSRVS